MKKIFLFVAGLLTVCTALHFQPAQAQEKRLTLDDMGAYYPEYVYGVNPLADGESYSQLADGGKRIVRRSFKDGKELGVIFDVEKAKGSTKLESIDGYIMSPDERRILLRTPTKQIYRRSFTAV